MTQPDDVNREGGGQQPPTPGTPPGSGKLGGDPEWLNRHNRPPAPEPAGPASEAAVEGEILDGDQRGSTDADALLAEVFDASELEAELAAVESEGSAVTDQVAALTSDLQRLHAEYSNYRKRVERDRELVRERAVEGAISTLFPVLDDIELAGQHGELVGGFKSVSDKLVAALAGLGLRAFGEVGEGFDPNRHEALMREDVEGVTEPTVVRVLAVGYEMNGRVLRAARVSVAGTD